MDLLPDRLTGPRDRATRPAVGWLHSWLQNEWNSTAVRSATPRDHWQSTELIPCWSRLCWLVETAALLHVWPRQLLRLKVQPVRPGSVASWHLGQCKTYLVPVANDLGQGQVASQEFGVSLAVCFLLPSASWTSSLAPLWPAHRAKPAGSLVCVDWRSASSFSKVKLPREPSELNPSLDSAWRAWLFA